MTVEDDFFALLLDFVFRLLETPIFGGALLRESKTTVGMPGIPMGIEFEFGASFLPCISLTFILEFESSRNRSNLGMEEKCMIDGGGF